MKTAIKPTRKVRPVTVTIDGDLAETIRKAARTIGFRADTWARLCINTGNLMTDNTEEAKEYRLGMAQSILREEGFACVRILPTTKERSVA